MLDDHRLPTCYKYQCRKGAGVHAQRTSIVSGGGWGQKTSAQGMSLESPNFTSPIPARQSFGQKPFRNCSCTLSTKSCQGTLCSPPQSWTGMAAWPPSSHRTSETCSNIEHSPHADKMLKQVSQNALSPVSEMLAFTVSYVCDMNNILRYIYTCQENSGTSRHCKTEGSGKETSPQKQGALCTNIFSKTRSTHAKFEGPMTTVQMLCLEVSRWNEIPMIVIAWPVLGHNQPLP